MNTIYLKSDKDKHYCAIGQKNPLDWGFLGHIYNIFTKNKEVQNIILSS